MKSILIVDDSSVSRQEIYASFKKAGFSVSNTSNGKDALDIANEKQYDLVITDLNMPIMDGLTLVRNLRILPSYKNTPILVLSAENQTKFKVEGRAAGASGWIVKPFIPNFHIQAICKFLDYRKKTVKS